MTPASLKAVLTASELAVVSVACVLSEHTIDSVAQTSMQLCCCPP